MSTTAFDLEETMTDSIEFSEGPIFEARTTNNGRTWFTTAAADLIAKPGATFTSSRHVGSFVILRTVPTPMNRVVRFEAASVNALGQTLPIIGIGGYATSGKDEVATTLAKSFGYRARGMSDVLDEFLIQQGPAIIIQPGEPGWDHPWGAVRAAGDEAIAVSYSDIRTVLSYSDAKKIRDVRRILVTTGTEAGRRLINDRVWVDIAERSAGRIAGDNQRKGYPTVITGIRYPSELNMVQQANGFNIWIDRPLITTLHEKAKEAGDTLAQHSSENTLTKEDFDFVIVNDGSLVDLYDKVVQFMHDLPNDRGGLSRDDNDAIEF